MNCLGKQILEEFGATVFDRDIKTLPLVVHKLETATRRELLGLGLQT
jgi:hypothetical protein